MDEQKNMISEAARQVDVESHVLRYWEEELHIPVNRTEMGHRYYTKEDIQLFCCIKKLKDEGVSIKELKKIVPELLEARKAQLLKAREKKGAEKEDGKEPAEKGCAPETDPGKPAAAKESPAAKEADKTCTDIRPAEDAPDIITDMPLQQVRELLGNVLTEIVTANNGVLKDEISRTVTSDVLKEMEFLMQAKDRRDEEHFRKLDLLIRQQQNLRRESAKAGTIGKLKRIFT